MFCTPHVPKMKAVQPKMQELKERYAADTQKQQQALMELYRKEKINPLAGCLPILPQIPIFFALYQTLFNAIEMRHAPFILWIKDMSAPDPTSILNLFGLLPFAAPDESSMLALLSIGVFPILLGIMFLARGVPALVVYRETLDFNQRKALALHCSTQLPLVVAISSIGVKREIIPPDQAAAMVGAAVLSLIIFPILAGRYRPPVGGAVGGAGAVARAARDLAVGAGNRSAMCDDRGRVQGLIDVHCTGQDRFDIVLEGVTAEWFEDGAAPSFCGRPCAGRSRPRRKNSRSS